MVTDIGVGREKGSDERNKRIGGRKNKRERRRDREMAVALQDACRNKPEKERGFGVVWGGPIAGNTRTLLHCHSEFDFSSGRF